MMIYLFTENFEHKPKIFFDSEHMVVRQIFARTGYATGLLQGREYCDDLCSDLYTSVKYEKIYDYNVFDEYYIDVAKNIILSKLLLGI